MPPRDRRGNRGRVCLFVKQQHRIQSACPPHRLQKPARHRADIGPPMAPQLSLIVHSAQAEAFEFAA